MSDQTTAEILRKKFRPEEVGKLPRVTCPDCSDKRKQCSEHQKRKCNVCSAYVSERHIHIDYVGHADVTARLLEADAEWNWEPLSTDDKGLPVFDADDRGNPVGLWIRLTVGGVTRLGYGSVPYDQPDAVKVLIGDALRNAAMRFGVALDLWAKGDRADPTAENATASAGQAARNGRQQPAANGNGQGQITRPAAAPAPAAVPGEPDADAQPYADEAHEAVTSAAIRDIHTRAREAPGHKLAALITNPATKGTGGLGAYLNYRRSVLEKAEKALAELEEQGRRLGLTREELDAEVLRQAGVSVEDATAEDLGKVTATLAATPEPAGVS